FAFQEETAPPRFGDLEIEPLGLHPGSAQVDLTLVTSARPGGLGVAWEYSTELFDATRIARMTHCFEHLLTAAVADPELPVGRLPMLAAAERFQLLSELSTRPAAAPPPAPIHEAVARVAERRPHAVAVEMATAAISFGELERRSERLARRLRALGAGPEVVVALGLERGPEVVVAMLAILKAGAVYLPLELDDPEPRTAFMLQDSGARLLVTRESLRARFDAVADGAIVLTVDGADASGETAPLAAPSDPRQLAYVIYTSGSTGRPKGVAVPHGPAAAHFELWRQEQRLDADDRVCQFASFAFDASLEQTLPTLLAGACLVLRDREIPAAEDFVRWSEERRLSVIYLPAAYWRQVTEAWRKSAAGSPGRGVRLVNPGGDVMAPESAGRFHSSPLAGARLLNGYGPTEGVVTAATYEVPGRSCGERRGERIPIGRPFRQRSIYVLDRGGEPAPLGGWGELCIGGGLLARGYLGRPRQTAERFVPDPFSDRCGARSYRTGDLASFKPCGNLDFLGRLDHQVKVRGFRIELGEVEAALTRLPEVRHAAVVTSPAASGTRRLIAYYVPAGEPPEPLELRRQLQDSLPAHMVPAQILELAELPLTASGKVDRRALPETATETATETAAPANRTEEILAAAWAEILGQPRVGVHDDFFTLGGDSILSLQIISRVRAAGLRLTPAQFFSYPTVAQLAAVAEEMAEERVVEVEGTGPMGLLPIQHWFFEQGFAEPHHWNQAVMLEVDFALDAGWLRHALAITTDHHQALRLTFARERESWRQVPQPPPASDRVPLTCADLSALPASARETAVTELAARTQASLDFEHGPLWHLALIRQRPRQPDRLLLVFHHLIMDGVSWRIVIGDLLTIYEQLVAGRTPALPPPSTSLRTWVAGLSEIADSDRLRAELPHWSSTGEPMADPLPADHPQGRDTVAVSSAVTVRLDARQTRRLLTEAPRAYHTQINDLLLTALVQACGRRNGGRLLVELEGHGREDLLPGVDLSRTVGWLTAKFPVRLDLSALADPTAPGEALKTVKEQLRRVPRRGIGFGLLAYLGQRPEVVERLRDLPPPAVTFNYLGRFDEGFDSSRTVRFLAGGAGPECGPANRLPRPLEVVGMVVDGELELRFTFSAERYRRATIETLARDYASALDHLVEHCVSREVPSFTPSDFPLAELDPKTLDRLAESFPDLTDLYPISPVQSGMLFHSLAAPESGVYIEQLVCELEGRLDVDTFRAAWQGVMDQHAILRTAFAWDGVDEPLQVLVADAEPQLEVLDWRRLPAAEQQEQLEQWLIRDRRRGFDARQAPLMRLFLARLGERHLAFVWTIHHLLIDGWAEPIVLQDFFALYQALEHQREISLPRRRPYRDYIAWLGEQDTDAARRFWQESLAGFRRPNRLPRDPAAAGHGHVEQELRLPAAKTAALGELCRRHGLTLNTVIGGLWALRLAHACDARDVVLGLTISGRPADLAGAEEMVGMFINTLPLRAQIQPAAAAVPWLRDLQGQTARLLEYGFSSLVEVQKASEVPSGEPLFETIVVLMNLPRDFSARRPEDSAESRLLSVRGIEQTNYPLTLTAWTEDQLLLQINYDTECFEPQTVQAMLEDLEILASALSEQPETNLEELFEKLAAAEGKRRRDQAERLRTLRQRAFQGLRRRPGQQPREEAR
ncbi:MAG: amino acid adenylation domain-containing protein, partial [Thermoanaerobaculia bacterium]